jgi:hypothetical protein
MKKILYILPLLLLWSCTPDLLEVEPIGEIHIDTNITYTNEKIEGKAGSNSLRIYTRALPKGSYNFLVKDNQDNIIKQTTIKL